MPQEELETLARAIGLPAVGGSWPAARHKARVIQFQQILDGGKPAGWDGPHGVVSPSLTAARPAAAVAATHAEVDGDDDDEDDEEDTARCKEMFGMASQQQPWSNSQQSGTSLDEQLSATQPFEDSQSYSQGYSQELDGDDEGEEHAADTQQLSQASNAETLPYEMSQSLSQRMSDVEDEDEDEDGGTRSPILGDDVSDDDELFGPRASQSLSPSPPPKPPRLPTPIPVHGHTAARSPSVGRSGSDTPMSAPGTRSPPSSAEDRNKDPTPAQPLQRNDSNGAKAATAALGPRGPFALAAAAAARVRSRSASRSPSVGTSPTPPVVKPCPIKADVSGAGPAAKSKTKPAARRASGRSKAKLAASNLAVSDADGATGNNAPSEPSAPSSASNQWTLDNFLFRKRKPAAQPPAGSRLQAAVGAVRNGGRSDTPPPQGADSGGVTAAAAAPAPVAAATSPSTKRSRTTTVARGGQSRKVAKPVGFKVPRRLSEVQQLQQARIDPRCSSSRDDGVATSPATKRPRRSARR
eukprot:COSAG02_NODE_3260_length_7078_cov_6.096432_1_plen_525_part_00